MQRTSVVDIIPPQPPPHLCNNDTGPSTPTPSRLDLQKKISGKWYSSLRFSAPNGNSQHYHRYKPDTMTVSPYSEEKELALSPTPSSSTHLPANGYVKTDDMKRSRSFAYGSQSVSTSAMPNTTLKKRTAATTSVNSKSAAVISPTIYPALLSRTACELQRNMMAADHFKNGIEYKNSFTGQEVVDHLSRILSTNDRFLALMVGRALGSQRFFHDVSYENRLVDSVEELYQFEENANYFNKTSNTMHSKKNNNNNLASFSQYHDDSSLQPCDSPTTTLSPSATTASNSSINEPYALPSDDVARLEKCTMVIPNGIITELTYCYAPTCRGSSPCYSHTCPKRQSTKRHVMTGHNNQLLCPQNHTLWADLVPESEYNATSPKERKRQEAIYELIYTETNYIKDLEYLDEMWIQPLTKTDIIHESRRPTFVDTVFSNVASIYAVNVRLMSALLARQKERLAVHAIGDIMLDFVVDFEPYIEYCARQHAAKNALEHERYVNPGFDWFINDTERHPSSQKLELNGYLTKPTTRLGKYLLLLHEILKRTPENHPDYLDIPKAIAIIKQFLTRMNVQAGRTKNRFDLERIHESLEFKNKADAVDLGLLNDSRVIIKQGTLRKTPNSDSTEYQVILLDHYLVVAKVKIGLGGALKYVIQKRPMSLDLLTVFVPKEFKEYIAPSNYNSTQRQSAISSASSNSDNNENGSDHMANDYGKSAKRHSNAVLCQKRPSSILPYVNVNNTSSPMMLRPFNDPTYYSSSHQSNDNNSSKSATFNMTPSTIIHERERKIGYPIVFDYLGRRSHSDILILYASSNATRKPWVDKIMKQQSERRQRNKPKFDVVSAVEPGHFGLSVRINHMVTFNNGQQYILATDDGVFVGHTTGRKTPHRILNLPKVTQIQVVESAQMLLVLSDRTLWDYGLDVVNGKPDSQPLGKRVQSHVPFFYVGHSLHRLMVCVPRVSALKSTITTFEPIGNRMPTTNNGSDRGGNESGGGSLTTSGTNSSMDSGLVNSNSNSGKDGASSRLSLDYHRRKTVGLLDRMAQLRMGPQLQSGVRLKQLKDFYVPSEVWAIELSPSKMLITTSRGMIMVDMQTDQPQQLLDPADKDLMFVTDREREELSHIRQPLKHIAIFRTPRGDHFVCYDEYGFYIDSKGNRLYPKFLVKWEGNPEAFACQYPHIIAFEPTFIEIRHIVTGELEQIIRGSHIRCLNNGHKTSKEQIFGVMSDEHRRQYSIFELKLTTNHQSTSSPPTAALPIPSSSSYPVHHLDTS